MNYAVLYDLNAVRIGFATFEQALKQLEGKISYVKLYGYNAKRNNDYTDFVRSYAAHVAVPLANRKKVRIDIRQVIDAIMLAGTNPKIDGFFIICSPIDALPMINALRQMGKRVVLGALGEDFLTEQCDDFILLERLAEVEDLTQNALSAAETIEEPDQAAQPQEDTAFLPYTDAPDSGEEQMREVKSELRKMIEEKNSRRRQSDLRQSAVQLDELLKKYF